MVENRLMKDPNKVDLTDGGATSLHSHPGGGGVDVKGGVETNIAENSTRAVVFGTAFALTPSVTLTITDSLGRNCHLEAISRSTTGFTISVIKTQGGGAQNRDVCWIATDAGDP